MLTIPMAKELCMIQRTDIGRKFRQYFISIEEAGSRSKGIDRNNILSSISGKKLSTNTVGKVQKFVRLSLSELRRCVF